MIIMYYFNNMHFLYNYYLKLNNIIIFKIFLTKIN